MKSTIGLLFVAALNARQEKQYATAWDMISAKYIDYISTTYMGNLIKDTHAAYTLFTGDVLPESRTAKIQKDLEKIRPNVPNKKQS